ncbi:hypothetical protein Cgig2_033104 [Carnegiea gigantea]|uniref:ADP-ribosylation factor 1 n=1 Tax=Carnegiea gigantea TaxID=171969 RepID=A0A9Q1K0Q5_9CARY|nr:hypothetical protein Cgig2_033104 [Carnegiea gigantea]
MAEQEKEEEKKQEQQPNGNRKATKRAETTEEEEGKKNSQQRRKRNGDSYLEICGGQTSIRPYWRCYFPNTQAIIYVVDSSDTDRLGIAKDEFHAILQEEELKGAVVLIFANKQDLPGALDAAAVTESLELHKIKNRQWAIFKTSATKGEGLYEGLDW